MCKDRCEAFRLLHTTVFIEHHPATPIYLHFNPLQPQFIGSKSVVIIPQHCSITTWPRSTWMQWPRCWPEALAWSSPWSLGWHGCWNGTTFAGRPPAWCCWQPGNHGRRRSSRAIPWDVCRRKSSRVPGTCTKTGSPVFGPSWTEGSDTVLRCRIIYLYNIRIYIYIIYIYIIYYILYIMFLGI